MEWLTEHFEFAAMPPPRDELLDAHRASCRDMLSRSVVDCKGVLGPDQVYESLFDFLYSDLSIYGGKVQHRCSPASGQMEPLHGVSLIVTIIPCVSGFLKVPYGMEPHLPARP